MNFQTIFIRRSLDAAKRPTSPRLFIERTARYEQRSAACFCVLDKRAYPGEGNPKSKWQNGQDISLRLGSPSPNRVWDLQFWSFGFV
jgi:hypothetical protein